MNQIGDITRRRKVCHNCEGRFTTYERVEEVMPSIIKKDGRIESYSRDKILQGVKKATQKRPIHSEAIETLIKGIENRIQCFGAKELPSRTVGEMVIQELHTLDKVAYIRFASVYREFKDVDEFVFELKQKTTKEEPEENQSLSFDFSR